MAQNKLVFDAYFSELIQTRVSANATGSKELEHQFRPVLKKFLESMLPNIQALNEPGKSEFGMPDFALIKNRWPIGYVETKRLGANLDEVAGGEQMKRYFGYANLVLTNYIEFRFYKHGERYGEPIAIANSTILAPDERACELLRSTFSAFLEEAAEPVRRAETLAKIMGESAKRLRGNLLRFLTKPDDLKNQSILEIYQAFKTQLIHDLSIESFADMYAQTLVYGFFVAHYYDESSKTFGRREARDLIPATNPLLRRFFDHITGADFDARLEPIVNELCKVFENADVRTLMQQLYRQDLWGGTQAGPDPVVHFYEDFLREYDAEQRKRLGAFYTPPPVVRFIVRSVDAVLKRDFGLVAGLADTTKTEITRTKSGKTAKTEIHKVQVLDPATGTGTFLTETIRCIRKSFDGQEGRFPQYVNDDLLPRIHGFELMMAPYTIAHLKIGTTLAESGATELKTRLGIYLTNSLEKGDMDDDSLFAALGLSQAISNEAREAAVIKNNMPIMVVIGNPPYSAVSSNETPYANDLVAKYKFEPGGKVKLQERKHWLNDDYVKFIALAEDTVEKTGEGVIAMITNNGYLDNPTFRGMRWHLTKTFDSIYIIDLHGSSKKKETSPDGSKDENIFSIMQGVSIGIFVRNREKKEGLATVYHSELFGRRTDKLTILDASSIENIEWSTVVLDSENIYFVPKNLAGSEEYKVGFSISDLFAKNTTGIVTGIDKLSIFPTIGELRKTTESILDTPDSFQKFSIKNGRKYKKEERVTELRYAAEQSPQVVSYRTFDDRFMFYTKKSECWINSPRTDVMTNFLGHHNLGLISCKQVKSGDSWQHIFISNHIIESSLISNKTGEINYIFPLYLYADDGSKIPNLKKEIIGEIEKIVGKTTPEDIFDYIYAVLHSPSYREKYKEFLKIDFPRVPYPKDEKQFTALVVLGRELRELHLLESPKVNQFITTYPVTSSDTVEKISYKDGKVFINKDQYFGNVPEVAWNFYIGGYQPAQKWLKDRKGRILNNEDIEHYQKMIVVLVETDRIMKEIDKIVL